MLPYAAYLRVYEPLSAFEEPELSRWVAYAASPHRPRRREALGAEYGEALRRVTALPPMVVAEQESEHAYIRWAEGVIYVCPWQTQLRSWLALGHLRSTARPPLADAFAPKPSAPAEPAGPGVLQTVPPARPAASNADIQKLRVEIARLDLLVKKLQTELQIERQYNQALEAQIRTLTESA